MEVLKFTISGETAFFKKPDVNEYAYFTYSHIHKVALLGIFGAILGLKGYGQMSKEDDFPEFYEKLKDIKVGIVPKGKGEFSKKIQLFNNTVGYASKEEGNVLNVRQQWLFEPKWDVYVVVDDTTQRLKEYLLESKCVYYPYLGSNDHPATISHVEMVNAEKLTKIERIDSLFFGDGVELAVGFFGKKETFKYQEYLPVGLDKLLNQYVYKKILFTDAAIESVSSNDIYKVGEKNIAFF